MYTNKEMQVQDVTVTSQIPTSRHSNMPMNSHIWLILRSLILVFIFRDLQISRYIGTRCHRGGEVLTWVPYHHYHHHGKDSHRENHTTSGAEDLTKKRVWETVDKTHSIHPSWVKIAKKKNKDYAKGPTYLWSNIKSLPPWPMNGYKRVI